MRAAEGGSLKFYTQFPSIHHIRVDSPPPQPPSNKLSYFYGDPGTESPFVGWLACRGLDLMGKGIIIIIMMTMRRMTSN